MTALERLTQLHAAFATAFADRPNPLTALMAGAITSQSETLCAAVVAHVEGVSSTTKEALALAAISREIASDATAPSLWLACDVLATHPEAHQTHESSLRSDGALRVAWGFRRERPTMIDGRPLACRILFPDRSAATQHVEAAGRVLGGVWRSWVPPIGDARAALLAAAIERNPPKK